MRSAIRKRSPASAARQIAGAAALLCLFMLSSCQQQQSPSTPSVESPPEKPSAQAKSIPFGDSLEEAFSRARHDGRRVLVYFTGEHCGWCRRMEKETHSDPRVIDLASQCVCVKVNVSQRRDLEERYAVYGIPRTLVMTADGRPVDAFPGYGPPAEHLPWLKKALRKSPTTWPELYASLRQADSGAAQQTASPPPACGFSENQADLVIWFLEQDPKNFQDQQWARHEALLRYLTSKGFRPRIVHYYRWQLSERWREAEAAHRLPDMLVAAARNGLFRDLMKSGAVGDAISTRLKQPDRWSVCRDFQGRWIWTVTNSLHAKRAEKAFWALCAPRDATDALPRANLADSERKAVVGLAANIAKWWCAGDVQSLRPHWDEQSTQRRASSESVELRERRNYFVRTDGVALLGNDRLVMAIVETRAEGTLPNGPAFCSKTQRLGTPTLVILRHHRPKWQTLAVGMLAYDINILPGAAELVAFTKGAARVAVAQLLAPANGTEIGNEEFPARWRLPPVGTDPPQFWLATTRDDHGYPTMVLQRISAHPCEGEIRQFVRSPTTAEIWAISADGQIAFSNRNHWGYRPKESR
jgi:thioredoxin-related protein